MNLKYGWLFLLALAFSSGAKAQQTYTVSGTIHDKSSGESLIGATVYLARPGHGAGRSLNGTVTNAYGFYSITVAPGNYMLVVSYLGYKQYTFSLTLTKNITQNASLRADDQQLQEIVVKSGKENDNVTRALNGVQKLSVREIQNVPVIFGEKDVLKTIQLLPGIKSAGEGSSGFYVRGGSADQNLLLLDEATVYNASHLLGFFSTFNSDAIKDLTVYKGDQPAEYGGRLSSVVDIKMNDGNNQRFRVNGGIGLIASRLSVEGPIVKNKGSFMLSGRRTYADLFLKLSGDSTINNNTLYFYDLNLKANYTLNDKNRLFVSGYLGNDKMVLGSNFGATYGNSTATARWNHIFSSRLFSTTSLIYSNYTYDINVNPGGASVVVKSRIVDYTLKQDFQYYRNADNKFSFGFNLIHHTLSPGVVNGEATTQYNSSNPPDKYALDNAAYAQHELTLRQNIRFNYGLRLSVFSVLGPGPFTVYDPDENVLTSHTYTTGSAVKTYTNLEPRFSMSYQVTENSSIKAGYARNVQNLHQLSNTTSTNPMDLWIPSSLNVKPELADQVSLGYYRNFGNNAYEFSAETYYKGLQNQIDYKPGASLIANVDVESQLLYGTGRAYGLELFLKKKTGKLTGWISYTLSRTERNIDGINNGAYYPARQDQTHNMAIVGIYQATRKLTLSSNWVYNTGFAVTFPSGKYDIGGQVVPLYTERNGYRMPAYHRLDLAATWLGKQTKRWQGSWTASVYNAYGRQNPYYIQFENNPTDPSRTQAVQTSLFRWVPSITYNFNY